jgi:hypothetical protein
MVNAFKSKTVIRGDRTVLNGYELDIYIPELNKAIEYNGVFFHSSKEKDRLYHYNKFANARKQGIDLMFIWEDDFVNDRIGTFHKIYNFLVNGNKTSDDIIETIKGELKEKEKIVIELPNKPEYNIAYNYIIKNYLTSEHIKINSVYKHRFNGDNQIYECYGEGLTILTIQK